MVNGRWRGGRLWRVTAAAAAVGVVVALPIVLRESAATVVPERTAEAAATTTTASVRVEHEFVSIEAEPPVVEPAILPARPPSRLLRQPKPGPAFMTPASTFTRARRTFLGDGRHRPEPFPRVR